MTSELTNEVVQLSYDSNAELPNLHEDVSPLNLDPCSSKRRGGTPPISLWSPVWARFGPRVGPVWASFWARDGVEDGDADEDGLWR